MVNFNDLFSLSFNMLPEACLAPMTHLSSGPRATTVDIVLGLDSSHSLESKMIQLPEVGLFDHRADFLCNNPNSAGPDFANLADGLFCRMWDKTLWPVCTANVTNNCFHFHARGFVVGHAASAELAYTRATLWGSLATGA